MIIQLESATTADLQAAKCSIETLTRSWGHEAIEAPTETRATPGTGNDNRKAIDPVAVSALVLSIPPAALAVLDLAERITKRRRAKELIDNSRQLAAQQVTIWLISPSRTDELQTLDPDHLLDLLADEDSAL